MASKSDDVDDVANWPPPIENYFVQLVHEEAKKGLQTSTLDKKTWGAIDNAIFTKFGKRYTIPKLKSKYNRLRMSHRAFAQLIAQTGIGWDPEKNKVYATDSFWESYLKKNPSAKSFRKKGLENYEVLGEIFSNTTASGDMYNSSRKDPPDSDTERELESKFLNSGAHVEASSSADTTSQSRRRPLDPPVDLPMKKESKVSKVSKMDDALEAWTKSLSAKTEATLARTEHIKNKESSSSVREVASIEDCMELLDSMDGVEDDVYVKAIEKFTNSDWRRIFIKMPDSRRRMWLDRLK
ncbi:Myb/SANT-like domain [Macleaya cordata]|uniref:Myb/SANT-like domain n=2 Tax=Macleaya cordata TaxID=56857 RepID=A0A200QV61_MACCD|nr:Myb/SANT-like domain [Macleaya cordata]OVA06680.1 Myb/SANT-like domain [Macleaya cordata]OVA10621.1 Myb/SANT-like domain [Macleaya cordata]OVA14366.1 Myb/SANT-like domain [Macleaya cordata]